MRVPAEANAPDAGVVIAPDLQGVRAFTDVSFPRQLLDVA
jgi:hypothetical protein